VEKKAAERDEPVRVHVERQEAEVEGQGPARSSRRRASALLVDL